ncbi:MAG: FIST C-terminal domain-containing protein [Pseudomonadota bacterium]|nr:FIST C-terminal domain-containing protein [Pseudomonadota bacterium]
MIIEQSQWKNSVGWIPGLDAGRLGKAQLAIVFGASHLIREGRLLAEVREAYPEAFLCGASTAGEIFGAQVDDDTMTVTAVHLERTRLQFAGEELGEDGDSARVGARLAGRLDKRGLKHVFVLSDGLRVNGSGLVRGLLSGLPEGVSVTGGLAADGDLFDATSVIFADEGKSGLVTAIGFYGDSLQVGHGSFGGWDPFGPERLVTRSQGNVLHEMDGKSALRLYKQYLGPHADELPASGLLFPLALRTGQGDKPPLVRTLLAVDATSGGMIFAGDIPEGSYARLMKANFDRLIDGAAHAARACKSSLGPFHPELAIMISCVGRKLILQQRIEEEVEAVRDILGRQTAYTGFYSYGEIAPTDAGAPCELHNQTMTITAFSENDRRA